METKDICKKVANAIFTKKGYDVKVIDLREHTSLTDFFVVCSADSDIQIKAIADEVEEQLRENLDLRCWHTEGLNKSNWVLMDYVDFVVHIFKNDMREYYALEKFWGDATIEEIVDTQLQKA